MESGPPDTHTRYALVEQLDQIILAVRQYKPKFLRPPTFAKIAQQLEEKIVAVLVASRYGCFALIISHQIAGGVRVDHLPLPLIIITPEVRNMAQSLRNALHLSGHDIRNPAFYDPRHFGYSLDHCCPSNPVPFGNPAVRTLHRSSHTSLVLCYWSVYLFTDPCCRRFYPDMQFVSSLCHFILYSKIERDSLGRLPCSASLVIAHHGRNEHSWPSTVTPRLSQSSKWFIHWLKSTQINLCVVLA